MASLNTSFIHLYFLFFLTQKEKAKLLADLERREKEAQDAAEAAETEAAKRRNGKPISCGFPSMMLGGATRCDRASNYAC